MKAIRFVVLAAVAASLTACGGARLGGGKEGAAQALFAVSQPGAQQGQARAAAVGSVHALALEAAKAQAQGTLEFGTRCAQGGYVYLQVDPERMLENEGAVTWSVRYADCSVDGESRLAGTVRMALAVTSSPTDASFSFVIKVKGRIDIHGEVEDYVDADVTQTLDFEQLGVREGELTLRLDGTVRTASGTYTYADEAVVIHVGVLPVADDGRS